MAETTDGAPAPTAAPAKKKKRRGGNTKLKNPEDRALRGAMIKARQLAGVKLDEVAKEFNISRATVYRALSEAKKSGIIAQAQDFVHQTLLPKALAVYSQALDEMDVEVARDVLQGLGITGRRVQVETKHSVAEDFDAWRLKKANKLGIIDVTAESADPADTAGVAAADPGGPPDTGLRLLEGPGAGNGGPSGPQDPPDCGAAAGEPGLPTEGLRTPGD